MSEFDLIAHWFNWESPPADVRLGVGDDAAILQLAPGQELLVSVDTLISGVHFPEHTPAHAIGHKALAVNLSDLAAMGAEPRWFTLALSLPKADHDWLSEFTRGLQELATRFGIFLVGGDTTRGPLSMTLQVMGTAPVGSALLRSGAQDGDLLCVSGTLGDAAAGLAVIQQRLSLGADAAAFCVQRLNYPTPRVELGKCLRQFAHSCMDISDGLLADLNHLLRRSGKGAKIYHSQLPFSSSLKNISDEFRLNYALSGGDDYELLFSISPDKLSQLNDYHKEFSGLIQVIGEITQNDGEIELDTDLTLKNQGYNHFK